MASSILEVAVFLVCFFHAVQCKIRIVDLTHLQNDESVAWPIYGPYNFTQMQRGPYGDSIPWVEFNRFGMTEHMGTHIDAPAHFAKGNWRTQQIPVERLMGPGVILNIKEKAEKNPDYRVVVDDITEYEEKYGRIPDGAIVIYYSGWYHKYPNKTLIFNTASHSDVANFHFPGFHEDTAQWLITHRHIYALGGDTPSYDYGQSKTYAVHRVISSENVMGIENAAYLDKIPESGSTIFLPVLKIYDGSGGPTRILATYDDEVDKPSSGGRETGIINISLIMAALCFALCV